MTSSEHHKKISGFFEKICCILGFFRSWCGIFIDFNLATLVSLTRYYVLNVGKCLLRDGLGKHGFYRWILRRNIRGGSRGVRRVLEHPSDLGNNFFGGLRPILLQFYLLPFKSFIISFTENYAHLPKLLYPLQSVHSCSTLLFPSMH